MKLIPLTQGMVAKVSNCDYAYVRQWKWCYRKCNNGKGGYAVRNRVRPERGTVLMHRVIAARKGLDLSVEIDHRDLDKLNNQRRNLRRATRAQNKSNCPMPSTNKSGFKGVSRITKTGGWLAQIKVNGRTKNLGSFPGTHAGKVEAARRYNEAALRYFGDFVRLNRGVAL
jgi:hypothetical protein